MPNRRLDRKRLEEVKVLTFLTSSLMNEYNLKWRGEINIFQGTETGFKAIERLANTESIVKFSYNDSGIRTKKVAGGVETKYYLDGTKVIYEKTGDKVIYYNYDENGQVIGLNDGTQYWYIKNAPNDIFDIIYNK